MLQFGSTCLTHDNDLKLSRYVQYRYTTHFYRSGALWRGGKKRKKTAEREGNERIEGRETSIRKRKQEKGEM